MLGEAIRNIPEGNQITSFCLKSGIQSERAHKTFRCFVSLEDPFTYRVPRIAGSKVNIFQSYVFYTQQHCLFWIA